MSQTMTFIPVKQPEWSPVAETELWEDNSPFGLQGLARESLQILKPDCVNRLAVTLALRATRKQLHDPDYVNRVLSWHPNWVDEYQVVHLIERSLWIQGHSDLVMTMIRNPSQIPDNPPPKIMQALSKAYMLHPDAAIWYGVPLFGEETNAQGLPIPVTAAEVKAESQRRVEAARQHALRWGWMYRAALKAVRVPTACWAYAQACRDRCVNSVRRFSGYINKTREDARRRVRAMAMAESERCRFGYSFTEVPEHRTTLGRSMETACVILEIMLYQASVAGYASPFLATLTTPLMIAKFAPIIFSPVPLMLMDPFLFVELSGEPGKLRHLGHWYWQKHEEGHETLHLHV